MYNRGTYSRVANRNLTVVAATDVLTQITSDGLDIGSSRGRRTVIDNLVTGEESEGVLVAGESINSSEDVLEVDIVVRLRGLGTVDGVFGSVDIEHQVDASISQGIHALVVVLRVVDRVDTDGVQTELLELGNVTLATIGISDGVSQVRGATGLVVDTANIETVISLEEGIALDGDGSDVRTGLDGGCCQNGGGTDGERRSNSRGLHYE